MNDKMKLIERLIKDGSIDLAEAMMLLETEKEQVFIQPHVIQQPIVYPAKPYPNTLRPYNPWPYEITCNHYVDPLLQPTYTIN